jgi:hypothetical protein
MLMYHGIQVMCVMLPRGSKSNVNLNVFNKRRGFFNTLCCAWYRFVPCAHKNSRQRE